jgi:hypothetical protein
MVDRRGVINGAVGVTPMAARDLAIAGEVDLADAVAAFQHMARSSHIGKVVINHRT